jgi:predicted nucleic acid-binding protein
VPGRAPPTRLVSSNYVLIEIVALLTSRRAVPRGAMINCVETIRAWPHITLVHVDPGLHEAAWALLRSRPDKSWSLTDCASFEVMRRRGLTEALTTDHHFEQAGFTRLPKP